MGAKSRKGKKGKRRRGRRRHDQDDEEERYLLAKSIGSASTNSNKGKKSNAAKQTSSTDANSAVQQKVQQKKSRKPQYVEQRVNQPARRHEHDHIKVADDELLLLEAGNANALNQIRKTHFLTGSPVADDELLYCIPCTAPFNLLKNFRYKIKLVPGKMKKGKACTQAQRIFLATSRDVARDTISALPRTRPKVEGGGIVSKADATSSRDAEYVDHEAIRQRLDEETKLINELRVENMVMTMLGDVKLAATAVQLQRQKAQAKAAARQKNKLLRQSEEAATKTKTQSKSTPNSSNSNNGNQKKNKKKKKQKNQNDLSELVKGGYLDSNKKSKSKRKTSKKKR